jgi:hypothetical protein
MTASDNDRPGILTDWQKYCMLGNLEKFNTNLFGCNGFGFVGFRVSAVISLFIRPKKEGTEVPS